MNAKPLLCSANSEVNKGSSSLITVCERVCLSINGDSVSVFIGLAVESLLAVYRL